ncbi:MAG: UvrD-helicase domain-containing protein, partial [Planctomycetes bacterium]|nr:UvrD-helicase domain-containing protein [Planctomycetota bacterium]
KTPDVVIRASAGTGKTFQLSNRNLAKLLSGIAPERMLATTFTRKAAGEILERILLRLAEAGLDANTCRELAVFLGDASLTPRVCQRMLAGLARQLHRVRVGTLDSFFSTVAHSFALELGLAPGWRILDDLEDETLRERAIDEVLKAESTSDVVRMMHLLSRGQAGRSVGELIRRTVDGLYSVYQQTSREAWRKIPRPRPLASDELTLTLVELADVSLPNDKRWETSRQAALACARANDWEAFLKNGVPCKLLASENTYYGKPIAGEPRRIFERLVKHARAILLGQLAEQTAATWDLLDKFHQHYVRLKREAGGLRFDDVTLRLARALGEAVAADRLAYRLDAAVDHLLLDEFQDTSLPQWQAVRPLAERTAASPERSFFCVGDTKQAIYGWRGGVAAIFDALAETLPGLETRPLDRSYRSAQPVIDAVNRVFARLDSHPNLQKAAPAARDWQAAFPLHTTACTELAGYVCLEGAPKAGEEQKQFDVTLAAAADRLAELARNCPHHTIGALVRKNATVTRLIYELRRRGVSASEEGGGTMTDAAAVLLIRSLLELADHPGHTAARFHVASSALGAGLEFTDHTDSAAAGRLAARVRRELVERGYGPVVLDWSRRLAPWCGRRDLARLEQLIELAWSWQPTATLRPGDFVRAINRQKVMDPTSDRVRVMTTHQAKGLEFDIVVLPDLDCDPLIGTRDSYVTGCDGPTEAPNRVCLYRNEIVQRLLPAEWQTIFAKWHHEAATESLCVLYVALTRAVHALYIIVAPTGKDAAKLPATAAGVVEWGLLEPPVVPAGKIACEFGNRNWHGHASGESESRESRVESREPDAGGVASLPPLAPRLSTLDSLKLADMPDGRRRGLDRSAPSKRHGGARVRLKHVFKEPDAFALERGTLFHAWLELVGWLEDGEPDDDLLMETARRLGCLTVPLDRAIREFRNALRQPPIANALSRMSYRPPRDLRLPPHVVAQLGEPLKGS